MLSAKFLWSDSFGANTIVEPLLEREWRSSLDFESQCAPVAGNNSTTITVRWVS